MGFVVPRSVVWILASGLYMGGLSSALAAPSVPPSQNRATPVARPAPARPAPAQTSVTQTTPASSSRFGLGGDLKLGVSSENFLNPTSGSQLKSSYQLVSAQWKGGFESSVLEGYLDAEGLIAVNDSDYKYLKVPEAYIGTSRTLFPVQFSLGRRLENWSYSDDYWGLGFWQPRFRWNYIRPESLGLTGGFVRYESSSVQVSVYGTPIFLPEQGGVFEFVNGNCVAKSAYFTCPGQKYKLFGDQETQFKYQLETGEIKDIVLNPGGAVTVRVGRNRGTWAKASYGYKPINQFLLAHLGTIQPIPGSDSVARVSLYPRVLYHHIGTLEAGYKQRGFSSWISYTREIPIRDETDPDWTTQEIGPSSTLSGFARFRLMGRGRSALRVSAGYLHREGGFRPDGDSLMQGNGSVFETRYPFERAISVGAKTGLPFLGKVGRKIIFDSRLINELTYEGSILVSQVSYRPARQWEVGLGADILGVGPKGDEPPGENSFISRYRGADRVYGSVNYVF